MINENQPGDNSKEEEKKSSENSIEGEENENVENTSEADKAESSEEKENAQESQSKEEEFIAPQPPPFPQTAPYVKSSPLQEPAQFQEPVPTKSAEFPQGFWKKIDYLLHHSDEIQESLRRDKDLVEISKTLFIVSLVMSAIYGAVMGGTNLFQGSEMAGYAKFVLIFVTAIKVPVLFLLTLVIVLPPIYVSNAMVGAKLSFRQILALLLASVAITSTALASMATVSLFFSLTSGNYSSLKLLHVLFFIYAGCAGLSYLIRTIAIIKPLGTRPTPQWIFVTWLLLYMFVGTQLAWVLRPFVGSPTEKFQLFRPRSGNIYESVFRSFEEIGRGED